MGRRVKRRRMRSAGARAMLAGSLMAGAVGVTWLAPTMQAHAAVSGRQGIEIEGARDRRGFFIGGGLGFGGTIYWIDDFMPALRTDLVLGGGVTKRFTLGADLHVTPYLTRPGGVVFGGDVEATGYLWRGLYLRGALGVAGVPKRDHENRDAEGFTVGMGGAAGLGYEFFLNATAAMSAGITYDARYVPGSAVPRQSFLVGVRFIWF